MLVRFIQGFSISAVSIGCRAIIVDNISGKRYAIAILYTSIGYGLGPIIGPFVGGLLQQFVGWQANFITLTIISAILLFFLIVFFRQEFRTFQFKYLM
jgi:MFS family permease